MILKIFIVLLILKLILQNLKVDYVGNEQQDAQEFLNFLLDGLQENLNKFKK